MPRRNTCRAIVEAGESGPTLRAYIDGLPLTDPRVDAARHALFGSWEGNWMPYNHANDVALPGGDGKSLPFLMYPQAQLDGVWLDPLAPATVKYDIQAVPI